MKVYFCRRNTPGNRTTTQPSVNHGFQAAEAQFKQVVPDHLLSIAHTLGCVIQCTTLTCTGALVWFPPSDPKLCGSPLDLLPGAPSSLLMPDIPAGDTEAIEDDRVTR